MIQQHFIDQAEAQRACEWWQARLRLQDWAVVVHIKRHWDLGRDYAGYVHTCEEHKHATILILDPIDWEPGESVQDHEETVVHELLHLGVKPFEPPDRKGPLYMAMEQHVQLTAEALVTLRRQSGQGWDAIPAAN